MCFSIRDGNLVLDAGRAGSIDSRARLVRLGDPGEYIPFDQLRAVASVFVVRQVRQSVNSRSINPTMVPGNVHCVVLVPRELRPGVAALVDALEAGRSPGPGYSVRGAATQLDEGSLTFASHLGDARRSRALAKAVARLTNLPMLELYGEFPVWRAANALDGSLMARLGRHPPPAPGPAPAGVQVVYAQGTLELSPAPGPRPPWLVRVLLAIMREETPPEILRVSPTSITLVRGRWEETFDVTRLEMMRVHEGTLVLVQHTDETRFNLGSEESAHWARAAIESFLAGGAAAYR
jgi:hypothetical protein